MHQLRHGDAKTTLQKYGHVVGDSQRRAVNALAEKIERQGVDLESAGKLESSQGYSKLFVFSESGAGDENRTHVRSLGSL
jgi:hypothetical protein